MLSLIFIASLVLPCVLGHCCFPDKISTVAYTAGSLSAVNLLVDFTQNKNIARPTAGDVTFVLTDMSELKTYTKFADGSCRIGKIPFSFPKCLTQAIGHIGPVTLAGTVADGYYIKTGEASGHAALVTEGCIPVVFIVTEGGKTTTNFYTNTTTSVTDVSDLNQDLSGCQ